MAPSRRFITRRRGIACILAMILLAVFSVLSLVLTTTSALGLRKSDNIRCVLAARLTAESGMAFMLERLDSVRLSGTTTEATFYLNLAKALGDDLDGTVNLAGQTVTNTGSSVSVPDIQTDEGSFSCTFTRLDQQHCRLAVRGVARGVNRTISMDFELIPKQAAVFDYGIASRGQVTISGNARVIGVNNPTEASVLSATELHNDAIHVDGNVVVSGDLYTAGDDTYVAITGNPSIAGSKDPEFYASHVHLGVETPDFPALDVAPIAALATNVVNSETDTSSKDLVFNNIRIAAGTNPVFSSDVVINGVVYVEAPNTVSFVARTTLNGIVVTQESDQPLESCQLHFGGNMEVHGVETLPDTPEFADIKQQQGTFVLAPGFGVTFAGHFSAVNGSIAADRLTFTGTAEGQVKGSVIGLKDVPTQLSGTVDIYVDRSDSGTNPAGFVKSLALEPLPDSYVEFTR